MKVYHTMTPEVAKSVDVQTKSDRNVGAQTPDGRINLRAIGLLVLFLLLVVGAGSAIGIATLPGEWYEGLIKPSFNPPNWVFGPVWTGLYVAIAVAGWRTWRRDRAGAAMKLWFVQMLANFLWSPAFFALQRIDLALGIILFLLVTILSFILMSWRRDRLSALLFAPYAIWVGFATALNGAILVLN